ncbi:TPA: hypothetical protein ACN983_004118 [Vibrio parahaemolyticus]
MSNLKKFELYVECTGINGHQVFACEAENEQAAEQMFRDGQCTIIDEQLEVTDLERHSFSIEESEDISSRLHSDVEHSLESKIKRLEHDKACLAELLQKILDTEGIIKTPHNRKVVKSVLEKYS